MSLEKYSAKEIWRRTSHRVQEINHWKNSESSTNVFTARASFRILDELNKPFIRGECINIDKSETIVKTCCEKYHYEINKFLHVFTHEKLKFSLHFINLIGCGLGILILHDFIPKIYGLLFGFFWLFIPITIILIANKYVMWRIWRKSMMPYIQLYVSLLEGYCFCDLCNWDIRVTAMAPPLFFHNLMIINSDAVYFKKHDKSLITIHLIIFVIWKLIIMVSLRFGYFKDIYQDDIVTIMVNQHVVNNTVINEDTVTINNGQLFFSKATSMVMLLIGQIIFRARHSEQAYALRTNYTIKSNKEWNEIHRKNRITKRLNLSKNVNSTKKFLMV